MTLEGTYEECKANRMKEVAKCHIRKTASHWSDKKALTPSLAKKFMKKHAYLGLCDLLMNKVDQPVQVLVVLNEIICMSLCGAVERAWDAVQLLCDAVWQVTPETATSPS